MKRHWFTRTLHLVLGVAVLHQLLISTVMQAPPHGKTENLAFEWHESVGLVSLGVVLLFWTWVLARKVDTSFSSLVPWFTASKRAAVIRDVRNLLTLTARRDLRGIETDNALASAVHGLGLLAVLAAATTGTAWLLLESSNAELAGSIIDVHEGVTTLVWAYLIGHAGLALAHEMTGHAILRRMFPFGRGGDR